MASPPADSMPVTRSFLLRDICSDQVMGKGRIRIIRSDTTLMTESATRAARWSRHWASMLKSQYPGTGSHMRILITKAMT